MSTTYDFQDLQASGTEATADKNYYQDYNRLSKEEKASVDALVTALRQKVFGIDFREALATLMETFFKLSSQNGNSNVELGQARSYFASLGDRLAYIDSLITSLDNNYTLSEAQINQILNSSGSDYQELLLWEGDVSNVDELITLSDSTNNYKYLFFEYYNYASERMRVETSNNSVVLRSFNLPNNDTTESITFSEITLSKNGSTGYKVTSSSSRLANDSGISVASDYISVRKIYGVKSSNAELEDLRIASDGSSYSSAGAALRAQIEKLAKELSDKISITDGQGLSSNDFSDYYKQVLENLSDLSEYADKYSDMEAQLKTLSTLSEGSTTADAELINIRTGANNEEYENAGSAVRGQFKTAYDEANRNKYIYPTRLGRYILHTGRYNIADSADFKTDYPQGMAIINDDKVVIANYNSAKKTNNVLLTEIALSTGEVLREQVVVAGHANSMTYDSETDKLYIAPLDTASDGSSTRWKSILVFNYSDFSFVEEIEMDIVVKSISKDVITNKFYICDNAAVYEWNKDTHETTLVFDGISSGDTHTLQTVQVFDGRFFATYTKPNYIIEFDSNGKALSYENLPINSDGYAIGELEDIGFTSTGHMLLYSAAMTIYPNYRYAQIWEMKKNSGVINEYRTNAADVSSDLYIKSTNTSWNPNGSSSNPFPTVQEALLTYFASPNAYRSIIFDDNAVYDEIIWTSVSMRLQGNGATVKQLVTSAAPFVVTDNLKYKVNNDGLAAAIVNQYGRLMVYDTTIEFVDGIELSQAIHNYRGELEIGGNFNAPSDLSRKIYNQSHKKLSHNKTDNHDIYDSYASSNGTGYQMGVTLNAVGSTASMSNGLALNLTNNRYKSLTLCGYSGVASTNRFSVTVPLTSAFDFSSGVKIKFPVSYIQGGVQLYLNSEITIDSTSKTIELTASNNYSVNNGTLTEEPNKRLVINRLLFGEAF